MRTPQPFGRLRGLAVIVLVAAPHLLSAALACEPASELRAEDAQEFARLDAPGQPVDPDDVDYALLAEAIYHATNERRAGSQEALRPLAHRTELDAAACEHATAMVEQGFFAHENPAEESLATPADRVREQGLEFRYVAENIGQVFALRYEAGEPVFTRQEGNGTVFATEPGGEPLGFRSYLELADALLDGWMNSPGHRTNILSEDAREFGAGCELTEDDELGMPMFACVQVFFAPL